MEKTLLLLWEYKFVILTVVFLALSLHYKDAVKKTELSYQKALLEKDAEYHDKVQKQYEQLLNKIGDVQTGLNTVQENYVETQRNTSLIFNKLDSDSNRLQSKIETIANTSTKGVDSELASSVRELSIVSRDCVGAFVEMGGYAQQERDAKETLKESWKEVQKVYNTE